MDGDAAVGGAGAVLDHGDVVGAGVAGPGEEHPVPGLGDVGAGGDEGIVALHPLVAPVFQIAVPGDVAPLADVPGTPGVGTGVAGVDFPQQAGAVLLIDLIDAPVEVLGAPLGGGVPGPGAVLGDAVAVLALSDLIGGDLQQPPHIVGHGPGGLDDLIRQRAAAEQQAQGPQHRRDEQTLHAHRSFYDQSSAGTSRVTVRESGVAWQTRARTVTPAAAASRSAAPKAGSVASLGRRARTPERCSRKQTAAS